MNLPIIVLSKENHRNQNVVALRFDKDLRTQKRYAENTQLNYQGYFKDFIRHFEGSDLKEISKDEINAYILNLIKTRNISPSQQNQRINAIKFYYEMVLGHSSSKTTEIYTPIADIALAKIKSPIDRLNKFI